LPDDEPVAKVNKKGPVTTGPKTIFQTVYGSIETDINPMKRIFYLVMAINLLISGGWLIIAGHVQDVSAQSQQSGSVGIEGRISSPPPSQGATISIPTNGQSFSTLPVTVSGLCPGDVLVKLFKNNVFAGSTQCTNGSFSLIIDLFNGSNELIARVYDALDQAGPDSNAVNVTYGTPSRATPSRVSLTSNFAKRGTNPGQELVWPIILSGGTGPYAISVDWGDGKTPDLISQQFPGTFNIRHVYDNPGIYNIIVKATDKDGGVAFLQLVGVANGPLSQTSADAQGDDEQVATPAPRILWQPAALMIPLIFSTFWLGKKYQLKLIRKKIERGDRPF
jgi:hypothetical protein